MFIDFRGIQREREKAIEVRERYRSVASHTHPDWDWICNLCMRSDQESNPQPFGVWDNAPTNWDTWPVVSVVKWSVVSNGFLKPLAKGPQVPPEEDTASSGSWLLIFHHLYSHLTYKFPFRIKVVTYSYEICDLYKEVYIASEQNKTRLKCSLCPVYQAIFPQDCAWIEGHFSPIHTKALYGLPFLVKQGCSLPLDLLTPLGWGI